MITLKEWMEIVDYRITEGSEGGYTEFGNNVHSLSAWNGDHEGWSFNIVFNTKDQTVFMVEVCDYKHDRAYRLINPDYKKKFKKANKSYSYADQAWDDVDFIDLEVDDDWMSKAMAIVSGEDYDTKVSVPLNIPDDELFKYLLLAHQRDITFNQLVEEALREAIEQRKDLLDDQEED